jgi:ABC-2 type transport system ATP-binding protein
VRKLSVDVQELTKRFGDFTAVDRVSFRIPEGSIFGFLGANGAGKSTTIRMLLGITPVTSGQGQVLGRDIRTQAQEIRSRVGYMAQKFSLYEDLTVAENLNFFAGLFGLQGQGKRQRIGHLVELTRLQGTEKEFAKDLPGGIRQRLALAVAMVHDPDIIFLDEPTGAVDPALRRYFWELIVDLSVAGKTVMVTSHYMDEVERCDNICFIHSGRLIAQGNPSELKSNYLSGQAMEVLSKRRPWMVDWLATQPGVSNPSPAGASVRFLFKGSALERDMLGQGFTELARVGETLKETRPTLEDVFLSLVAGQRDAASC